MDNFDRYEQLAATAQFSAAILANPSRTDFVLVPVGGEYPPDIREQLDARGMCNFVGVVGMVEGKPETRLTEPLADEVIDRLATAFVARVMEKIRGQEVGDDSEDFLWRLWALKDPRLDA
jgi:hypothetical protein